MTKITLHDHEVTIQAIEFDLSDIISDIGASDFIEAFDDNEAIIRELDEDDIIRHFDWSQMNDTEGLATALGNELFGTIDELREFCGHVIRAMQNGIDGDIAEAAARGVVDQAKSDIDH